MSTGPRIHTALLPSTYGLWPVVTSMFTSIYRWMPTRRHPFSSHHDGDDMVQLQRDHRGSTAGRASDDARPVFTPAKMTPPSLAARMKQTHPPSTQWVSPPHLCSLETVAHAAGQPKVRFVITSATRFGNDVFDFQQPKHVALRALTIAATVASRCANTTPNGSGDRPGTHGSSGSRSLRRTASCRACALRNRPS